MQESQRGVSSVSSLTSPVPASLSGKVSISLSSITGTCLITSCLQPAGSRKQSQVRRAVRCVKRIKGRKGKPDTFDLLVQIDRVGRVVDC